MSKKEVIERPIDWETIPLEEGLAELAFRLQECERVSAILNRRNSPGIQPVSCIMAHSKKRPAGCKVDVYPDKVAFSKVRKNPETQTFETLYACSATCHTAYLMGVQAGEIEW